MRFLCLGYADEKKFETMTEKQMNVFMDECFGYDDVLRRDGHFVGGEGLQNTRSAATLRYSNSRIVVTDGPFAETKEQIGGIMFLEAKDLRHAIELMSKHPSLRLGGGSWEIRPLADLTAAVKESESRRMKAK